MIISPDHTIAIRDLYPVESSQTIIDALEGLGCEQHECGPTVEPEVNVTIDETTTTTVTATFNPNGECASYYYVIGIESEMQMWVSMMGVAIEQLVQQWGIQTTTQETYTWDELIPGTEYTIYVLPMDAEGNAAEMTRTLVTTQTSGGTGEAIVTLEIEVLNSTSVHTIATPNEEVSEYHYGLITQNYCNEIGMDSTIAYFQQDPYIFYAVDDFVWEDLEPNTYYYGIAVAQNALGEWGSPTVVEFYTSLTGMPEQSFSTSIYPNPANESLTLQGEKLGTVSIFNVLGQKVDEFQTESTELNINTSGYENGIYFVKTEGQTLRFVVTH